MEDQLLIARSIYALGTLAAAGAAGLLWQYRERTGAPALLVMMGAMVLWNGSLFAFSVTERPGVAAVLIRVVFVGVALVSIAKLVFVLEYTGREHLIRPRILAILAIPPALTVIMAFLNPGDLFFTTLESTPEAIGPIEVEFGRGSLIPLLYSYGLNVVVTVMILGFIYRSQAVYRGQSLALLGGALATWIANMVFVMDIVPFDTTAIGSVVSGVLFTVAIVRYQLLDIMPIARDRVLDAVNDGVFVLDREHRLVDVNPAGRLMLSMAGVESDDLVGKRFPDLFDDPELRDRYLSGTSTREETSEHVAVGHAHFQINASPIDDGRNRHVGWLLIAHDVTERKRREERLEAQNERLEQFASLVSHDLRNPLTVADGYLELARETADTDDHLEKVAQAHDRMETIIEDVLALAREGEDVTDPEPVALDSITERAWNGVATDDAVLTVDTDASVLADPDRLRRLLENLFRNSIEHGSGGEGSTDLEVSVRSIDGDTNGSTVGFVVEDDGVGIPTEECDRILEDGYSTGEDGTGLGLSIVESIATAHGWSLDVDESAAGGVRFEFTGVEATESAVATEAVGEQLDRM